MIDRLHSFARWFVANLDALALGCLAAAVIVGLMLLLRTFGQRTIDSDPECRTWRGVIGRVLAKTSFAFMIVAAIDMVVSYADPPPKIARLSDILFTIGFALQGAVWARELILGVIGRNISEEAGESTIGNAMGVIRVLISVALFTVALVVILDNLGINVTALVAGLGIGGIAIGLAAQGIFADLFAALAILFDRPFRRGDTIRYDQSIGTVEKIGLKTTRLRSVTGEQMVIANTKLLEREIHNLAQGHSRRSTLTFGVSYQTSPEALARIPQLAKAAVDTRRGCHLVRCALTGFGASSLDHELLFDDATLDADALAADRAAIMLALIRSFATEKIDFAYPTQVTFTAAPDGRLVMPWPEPKPA
ncbi:mechanosensitive ion channel family protein [Sphingomonas ginkgonis]|nr:mechanosensitive ion channel domain-containing protein [Sphingomonas ginkgonis]